MNRQQQEFEDKFAKYSAMLGYNNNNQPKKKGPTQKQKIKEATRTGGKVVVVPKTGGNKQKQISNVGKMLDEDYELKEIPREISVQVQQARNEKKLTQEQLAKKICEPTAAVSDLEKGDGVYDPKLVVKIEKALGVTFTRSWKKK
jgi:ribosome-binding protein aMBF1 (putative translation factor)